MFSESVNRCQWSRNGLHFAAGGGEGVLSVYNFDPEAVKAELFASYSCGNDILALDWSYAAGAASRSCCSMECRAAAWASSTWPRATFCAR